MFFLNNGLLHSQLSAGHATVYENFFRQVCFSKVLKKLASYNSKQKQKQLLNELLLTFLIAPVSTSKRNASLRFISCLKFGLDIICYIIFESYTESEHLLDDDRRSI